MNITRGAASLFGLAMLLLTASITIAQSEPEVRRARPVDEPPVRRAVPADESIDKVLRSLKDDVPESSSRETEGADQRQLEYANGLFARKLYDLAIPEYQKYLEDYPGRAGRANAYFSLGECYRNLHRDSNARTNLQKVLTEYGDSEFAGPAAFALAEMAFTDILKPAALKLSAGKTKPLIFTRRSPSPGIQIRIAKMHASRRQPSSPHGEKSSMR
jgi:tetratricopeptide (TPR) repeat protein